MVILKSRIPVPSTNNAVRFPYCTSVVTWSSSYYRVVIRFVESGAGLEPFERVVVLDKKLCPT